MKAALFQQLAARSTTLQAPEGKTVREQLGLSQNQFAALIGISPRSLLRVAECHTQPVLEALYR